MYVAPYRQYSGFARLENPKDNHAFGWWVAGTYDIQLLNFQTFWNENVMTDSTSLYDYFTGARKQITPMASDWSYNPTYALSSYEDPFLSFNLLNKIDSRWYNNPWNGESALWWQWVHKPAIVSP